MSNRHTNTCDAWKVLARFFLSFFLFSWLLFFISYTLLTRIQKVDRLYPWLLTSRQKASHFQSLYYYNQRQFIKNEIRKEKKKNRNTYIRQLFLVMVVIVWQYFRHHRRSSPMNSDFQPNRINLKQKWHKSTIGIRYDSELNEWLNSSAKENERSLWITLMAGEKNIDIKKMKYHQSSMEPKTTNENKMKSDEIVWFLCRKRTYFESMSVWSVYKYNTRQNVNDVLLNFIN